MTNPSYRVLYFETDQVKPKSSEMKEFPSDIEVSEYVSNLNKVRTNSLGFYRWERVTFLSEL